MKRKFLFAAAAFSVAAPLVAAQDPVGWRGTSPEKLVVTADKMAADNKTATLVATGHVKAVSAPYCLLSELVTKEGDTYNFAPGTRVTTCTNKVESQHFSLSGEVTYRDQHSAVVKNAVLRVYDVPVLWFPYWYYPLDTDYGWRVMPGYASKWGAYLMTKYLYSIAGGYGEGEWGLSGSSRFDVREKQGVAVGQGFRWQLGDFGRGRFRAYYAWDQDADRYDRHWSTRKYNHRNWSSDVPDRRYGLELEHLWLPTERDTVRLKGEYYSDSEFKGDFLRKGLFGADSRFSDSRGNELAWEHLENRFSLGVSVSGPINRFYEGVSRLPEVYFDVQPMALFSLPINYESETTAAFLNRDYGRLGDRDTATPFRYNPGEWADYQTFRFDTYHRFTMPFKVADVLSVVPRVGLRGTYWNRTGTDNTTGYGRAVKGSEDVTRLIAEGGVTFAARGKKWLTDDLEHTIEPYFDVLAQEAHYEGLSKTSRPYIFDSVDGSRDWLDQFAGSSRNLPYSYYGFTPGLRNALGKLNENGNVKTLLDLDVYAACQLNDTTYTDGGRYHRLASDPSRPNYGKHHGVVVPGVRARWRPDEDIALSSRLEYDTESSTLAYADVSWHQRVTKKFKYNVSFINRDHRMWDYSSTPYDSARLRDEDLNRARYSYVELTAEHELCDAIAWGPFVRWDCREGEVDEVGSWIDFRTDCLGFRFSAAYEADVTRVDNSRSSEDWRFGFNVYLRATGPSSGSVFGD